MVKLSLLTKQMLCSSLNDNENAKTTEYIKSKYYKKKTELAEANSKDFRSSLWMFVTPFLSHIQGSLRKIFFFT